MKLNPIWLNRFVNVITSFRALVAQLEVAASATEAAVTASEVAR